MIMMKSEEVHRRGSDNCISCSMNLTQKYQQAVDCLVHCEFIIMNLQQKAANKDTHIAGLEERMVGMSLELAQAKCIEDEHRLMKRRLSDLGTSTNGHELMQKTVGQLRGEPSSEDESLKLNYAPMSVRRKRSPSRLATDTTANLLHEDYQLDDDSRSCESSEDVEFLAWPDASEKEAVKRYPEPKRRGGFKLPSLSQGWEADATSGLKTDYLGDSQRSMLSDSSGLVCLYKCSSQQASNTSLKEESPGRSRDDTTRPSTRRLSSLGQLLRRSVSKNDLSHQPETTTATSDRPRTYINDIINSDLSKDIGETVVFPVTSDDCLQGLISRKDVYGGSVEISTNKTWQDFGVDQKHQDEKQKNV